jgi:predicted KAP-like P-loop ATPase
LLAELAEAISDIPEPTGLLKPATRLSSILLKRAAKDKEIYKLREEIKKSLKKQNKRILVVIDDIDRLEPEEINSMFRVIKAVSDFPKTTYLLAFDKDIIVKALGSIQKISDSKYGEEYLEKIVQVPIYLPSVDKIAVRKFFLYQIDHIFSNTSKKLFDQTDWYNIYLDGIDHFLNTMRDVKRLINAIKVSYPFVKDEVNPVDFIAIKTIEIFASDVYQLIRFNSDMFAGHSFEPSELRNVIPFYEKWIKEIPENNREVIKRLLIRIFPKFGTAFGGNHYGPEWEAEWRKKLRICSPDIFPIYFRLAVPEGEISNIEIQSILALTKNRESFKNKLLELSKQHRYDGSTRLSAFLERMVDYVEEIPKGDIPEILQAFFEVGDKLLLPEDEKVGLFSHGNDIRISRIILRLLKRYETQNERFKLLKKTFSKGRAVSTIVIITTILGQQHGKYGGEPESLETPIIDKSHLEELEKVALYKIKQTINELINTPMLITILHRWDDWEGEKPVREWVKQAIKSDEGLVKFLTNFLSKEYRQTITDQVPKIDWRFNLESLNLFLNSSEIINRCRYILNLSPNWLEEKSKIALKLLLDSYTKEQKRTDK